MIRQLRAALPAGALRRTTPAEAPMTVTSLPPSADALLLENQRLKLGASKEEQPKLPEPLNQNMVDVRLRAMLLAPQVGHLRLDAGRVLVETKDYETARIVLTPLAGGPHGGPEAEAALAMLKSLPEDKPVAKATGGPDEKPATDKKG